MIDQSFEAMVFDGLNLLWSVSLLAAVAILVVVVVSAVAHRLALPAWFEHWCWRLVFLKILLALVITQPIQIPLLTAKPVDPIPHVSVDQSAIRLDSDSVIPRPNYSPLAVAVPSAAEARVVESRAKEAVQITRSNIDHSDSSEVNWLLCLAMVWLYGAILNVVVLSRQWWRVWRMPLQPISDPKLLEVCRQRSRLMGVRTPVIAACDTIPSPSLVGFLRPKIVLPTETMDQCGDADLDAILSHELAHLRRADLWWSLLPALVQVLLYFHPLVWLANSRWLISREKACDAQAIDRLDGSVSQYANSLLRIAELVSHRVQSHRMLGCVSVFHSASALKQRLVAMKGYQRTSLAKSSILACCLCVAGTIGGVPWTAVNRAAAAPAENDDKAAGNPVAFGKNMDFEEKSASNLAADWSGGNQSYAISLDNQNPHSGSTCGKIASKSGKEPFGTILQSIKPDGLRGKRIEYSGFLRTDVEGSGQLWMRVDLKKKPPMKELLNGGFEEAVEFKELKRFDNMSDRPVTGKTAWNQYKITLDVPENASSITFGLLMKGTGAVWADDLEIKVLSDVTPVPIPPARAKHWGGGGKGFELIRDTTEKHSGMGSGRIRKIDQASAGFGTYTTGLIPTKYLGKRVRYSGFLKSENTESAGLWMRVDGEDMKVLAFDDMQTRPVTGTTEWKQYEVVLDVPKEAKGLALGFLLSSKGTLWADDLKLEVVGDDREVTDMKIDPLTAKNYYRSKDFKNRDFKNGDFEETLGSSEHPIHWASGGNGYKLGRDKEVKYSGSASGRITRLNKSGKFRTFAQAFPATKYLGKRIRFRGYLKTKDATSAGLIVRIDGPKRGRVIRGQEVPEVLGFDNMSKRRVTGTTEWSSYEVVLDVPDDAKSIFLGFLLSGDGIVWADELSLDVVGSLGEGPPVTHMGL